MVNWVVRRRYNELDMFLKLTMEFLSVVDNLLGVSEETLRDSQGTANTSAK